MGGFCLWLPDAILEERRSEIAEALGRLPTVFNGYATRIGHSHRVGAMGIAAIYQAHTGLSHPPENWREWLAIPEIQLACAVNGEVFEDQAGIFSNWREILSSYYPEDVRLKKIAARVMIMAQSGQYNLPRSLERRDSAAAFLAIAQFMEAALSFVFLLNKQYMPYYKLAPRLVSSLPLLGGELSSTLKEIAVTPCAATVEAVEKFCSLCAAQLYSLGLAASKNPWLWAHGPTIAKKIKNSEIRSRNLLQD